jgi:hypothetical protein
VFITLSRNIYKRQQGVKFSMCQPQLSTFVKLPVYTDTPWALLLSEFNDGCLTVSVILLFRWHPHPKALPVFSRQLLTTRNYNALTWQSTGSVAPRTFSRRYLWRYVTLEASKHMGGLMKTSTGGHYLTDWPTVYLSKYFSQHVQ